VHRSTVATWGLPIWYPTTLARTPSWKDTTKLGTTRLTGQRVHAEKGCHTPCRGKGGRQRTPHSYSAEDTPHQVSDFAHDAGSDDPMHAAERRRQGRATAQSAPRTRKPGERSSNSGECSIPLRTSTAQRVTREVTCTSFARQIGSSSGAARSLRTATRAMTFCEPVEWSSESRNRDAKK